MHGPVNHAGQLLADFMAMRLDGQTGAGFGQGGGGAWTGRGAVSNLLFGEVDRATWSQATDSLWTVVAQANQGLEVEAGGPVDILARAWEENAQRRGVPPPRDHLPPVVGRSQVAPARRALPAARPVNIAQAAASPPGQGFGAQAPTVPSVRGGGSGQAEAGSGGGVGQFVQPAPVTLCGGGHAALPPLPSAVPAPTVALQTAAAAKPLPDSPRQAGPEPQPAGQAAPSGPGSQPEVVGQCGQSVAFVPPPPVRLGTDIPGVPSDIRQRQVVPAAAVAGSVLPVKAPPASYNRPPPLAEPSAPAARPSPSSAAVVGSAASGSSEPPPTANLWGAYQPGAASAAAIAATPPGQSRPHSSALAVAQHPQVAADPGAVGPAYLRGPRTGQFEGFMLGSEFGVSEGPSVADCRPVNYKGSAPQWIQTGRSGDPDGFKVLVHDLPGFVDPAAVLRWVYSDPTLGRQWAVDSQFSVHVHVSDKCTSRAARAIATVSSAAAAYQFYDSAWYWWVRAPGAPRGWKWCNVRFFEERASRQS